MDIQKTEIPTNIQAKFDALNASVEQIINRGHAALSTTINGKISLEYKSSAPRDILTDFERAQSVCFVTKYESLPAVNSVTIVEHEGKYFPSNIDYIRHVLNEYRPIVQNQEDSVHYQRIHAFCHLKLGADPTKDLSITVNHIDGRDVTSDFKKSLGERNKAIRTMIEECEFDYIYNGILQHSDHRFTERFWREYTNGDLNYIFIKHEKILEVIRDLLVWHYRVFHFLTFPKMGPL